MSWMYTSPTSTPFRIEAAPTDRPEAVSAWIPSAIENVFDDGKQAASRTGMPTVRMHAFTSSSETAAFPPFGFFTPLDLWVRLFRPIGRLRDVRTYVSVGRLSTKKWRTANGARERTCRLERAELLSIYMLYLTIRHCVRGVRGPRNHRGSRRRSRRSRRALRPWPWPWRPSPGPPSRTKSPRRSPRA